jgi:hypothetical protein
MWPAVPVEIGFQLIALGTAMAAAIAWRSRSHTAYRARTPF